MVVDDEDANQLLLETLLTRLDYEVIQAFNGKEALEKVKETPPSVILMDIKMPVMDGLEATKRLKESSETKLIPVVVVSSMSEVEDRVKALEAGADDFMSKPADPTELKARIRSLLKVKAYNDYMKHYQKSLESEVIKRTMQLREALEKVKLASLDTIFRLSQAAEYKDEDTGAHIVRMGFYAAAIARKLGLDQAETEALLYAAPMHDVGKIGIPDKILLKPGKLDPDEWEIMKTHTTIGAKILRGSDFETIKMAEVIAISHHEKWDGSGYPNGLNGENIPIVGRIAAIADVFDALTTKRPYKDAYSFEKSFDIIKDMANGGHFDPQVAKAFFDIEEEIVDIRQRKENGDTRISMMRQELI